MNELSIPAFLRRTELGASIAVAASSGASVNAPGQDSGLERAVRGVTRAIAAKTTTMVNVGLGTGKLHRQLVRELVDKMEEVGAAPVAAEAPLAIDDALRVAGTEYRKALEKEGLPIGTLALLENWIELQAVARAVQLQGDFQRTETLEIDAVPEAFGSQPAATAPLTALELGQALGVSDQTVRGRERAGELFSILRPGRRRGVEYPAFQAWPGIAGEPLAKTLAALASPDGTRASSTLAYAFFSGRTDLLGGLTPIEVLLGRLTTPRDLEPEVRALLGAPATERLDAVVRAAQTTAAVDAA